MRIGTWNLQGRWDERHRARIDEMDCDILLLTEVAERIELPTMTMHWSTMPMAEQRRWAAVVSRLPMDPMPDPHGASAMARIGDLAVCTSVLPWRACGIRDPWVGESTAEKTAAAVRAIEAGAPDVWGGDWNHAMSGREWAGSKEGRRHIVDAVERLELQVTTADAPHQIDGLLAIDHVAVPRSWSVRGVERHLATTDGVSISDHDAYVVEATPGP